MFSTTTTIKDYRSAIYNRTNSSIKKQPETLEQKFERVLEAIKKEDIQVTPQIKKLVWCQLQEREDKQKLNRYLSVFESYGLKPLKNEPPKVTLSEKSINSHRPSTKEIITKGIYFVPHRAFCALFPDVGWNPSFFEAQSWLSLIVKKEVIASRKIDVNEIVDRVTKMAVDLSTGNELKCFAFETAESVF